MAANFKIEGTHNSPVLVLSNSLGTDMGLWDEVVPHLLPYFRVLRYDTRGHGKNKNADPFASIEELGRDVLVMLDHLQLDKVHFCGISMGGLIGQWLGIHHSDRFNKIVISNTASKIGQEDKWNDRIALVESEGMTALWNATCKVWFTDDFIDQHPDEVVKQKRLFTENYIPGYVNACKAIRDADFSNDLDKIPNPTLIIAGDRDPSTTVDESWYLAKHISNATLQVLASKHLPCIENPSEFSAALIDFLVGEKTIEKGMHVRRTVLGNAHVDRSLQNKNPFNADFQEFISQYAWGEIWTRPGLSKPQRSLITMAMMIALNRTAEFKMHVLAAINNGVPVAEIKEVIMQSGIYCGLPAANEAFHLAQEVFKENNIDFY